MSEREDWGSRASELWAAKFRNPHALGVLRELAVAISSTLMREVDECEKGRLLVFCSDHGVSKEGLSLFPPMSTGHLCGIAGRGKLAVNCFAEEYACDLEFIDVGLWAPEEWDGLVSRRIRPGTANILVDDAMSEMECAEAFEVGVERARAAIDQKVSLLGVGEIGIGNSTVAAILAAGLLGAESSRVVGPGSGVDEATRARKAEVVEKVLARARGRWKSAVDLMRICGGLELIAISGAITAAVERRTPVVLDGFGTAVAALVAERTTGKVRGSLVASHVSTEPGHELVLRELGLTPLLDLRMGLGEGTGAVLGLGLCRLALRLLAVKTSSV